MNSRTVERRQLAWAALAVVVVVGGAAAPGRAATGDIHRFAGSAGTGAAPSVAQAPNALALHEGHLYVSDDTWSVVRRIDLASGQEDVVAGTGVAGFSGDGGPATAAQLSAPKGIAFDAAGNLFVADYGNDRIRRVDAGSGVITTVAGTGIEIFAGDGGPAVAAALFQPADVAFDAAGNLFVADSGNIRVRRIDAQTGVITTVAGADENVCTTVFPAPAKQACLFWPSSIAIDTLGHLLIVENSAEHVRQVDLATGILGDLYWALNANGFTGVSAAANGVALLTLRINGYYPAVVAIDHGSAVPVAGTPYALSGDGGPALDAVISGAQEAIADDAGNVFIAEQGGARVRRVDAATGIIGTIAGNGSCCSGGDGGLALDAQLGDEEVLGADRLGNVLTAQRYGLWLRRIDASNGRIDRIAGSGQWGGPGDGGPALDAQVSVVDATGDAAGNVFLADTNNYRIRRVDHATGIITTVAGNGSYGRASDGVVATSAPLGIVGALALDGAGNLFFTETAPAAGSSACAIRRVDAVSGKLKTVAGGGACVTRGDGGPATSAGFSSLGRIAWDPSGGIVAIDGSRVRRVDLLAGAVNAIAGNGSSGFSPDGTPATAASLASPSGVTVDFHGNVLIAERDSNRVRRISNGVLTTVAGTGADGFSGAGDGGPAHLAELYRPSGVAATLDRIYVAESAANRIRFIETDGSGCGDGVVDGGEQCDDGNLVAGDCCSPTCQLESSATLCRLSAGVCDVAEFCTGSSPTCPADALAASGATCTDDHNACTTDVCDGAGKCTHPNNTAPCDDGVFCNGADTCSAGACVVHAGNPCVGGPECQGTCVEVGTTCNSRAGTPCHDDGSYCTEDMCDGNGTCAHHPWRAGAVCRPSAGDCDVAETCDGVSPACPSDLFKTASTVCRGSSGECDVAELCTGASAQCPTDLHVAAGTACTLDSQICTSDVCDGSGACTHPPGNAGTTCRAAVGECDVAEKCTGTSSQCPADAHTPSGTACTPDSQICTADVCDGGGACSHPAGNTGATCRPAAGDCDVAEQCNGSSVTCPSDRLQSATVVCRGAAGECDLAEHCSGTSRSCPADGRAPAGTSCTPDAEICTADVCDGVGLACTHPPGNAGVECRASSNACDAAEVCDGLQSSCPADAAPTDSDGDGACDAHDPCTNVAGAQDFTSPPASSVVLAGVNTDTVPGNDKLKLVAFFDLPPGRTFADLRPHIDGARVSISGSDASTTLDVTLPPGAYGPATRRGWLPTGAGKGWTFVDKRPAPANGIVKLVVTNVGRAATPRRVKVVLTGKNGVYPLSVASAPIHASIALGNAADAAAGLCGESAYGAGNCAFNRSGNQLVCKS